MPSGCAECCGSTQASYCLCNKTKSMFYICPGHQAFDDLSEKRDDMCCICCNVQGTTIKPFFARGDLPCLKSVSKSWCCSSRCSCPLDDEQPGRCSLCPCCALPGGCCAAVDPIPEAAYGGFESAERKVTPKEEHVFCALPFCICTLFVPDSPEDGWGVEDKCTCCCWETKNYGMMPPQKRGAADQDIMINFGAANNCISPTTLLKYVSRTSCCYCAVTAFKSCCPCCAPCCICAECPTMHCKCAIPCDEDVPCALALCGLSLCGTNDYYKPMYCSCKTKARDEVAMNKGGMVGNEMMSRA